MTIYERFCYLLAALCGKLGLYTHFTDQTNVELTLYLK